MKKKYFCNLSALRISHKKKKKVMSRESTILDYHVGKTFHVHRGNGFFAVTVTPRMKGYRFGEFCLTRGRFSHKNKKD